MSAASSFEGGNIEFGGLIVRSAVADQHGQHRYKAIGPRMGGSGHVEIFEAPSAAYSGRLGAGKGRQHVEARVPDGYVPVAYWHTHNDTGPGAEFFSPGDLGASSFFDLDAYVGVSRGGDYLDLSGRTVGIGVVEPGDVMLAPKGTRYSINGMGAVVPLPNLTKDLDIRKVGQVPLKVDGYQVFIAAADRAGHLRREYTEPLDSDSITYLDDLDAVSHVDLEDYYRFHATAPIRLTDLRGAKSQGLADIVRSGQNAVVKAIRGFKYRGVESVFLPFGDDWFIATGAPMIRSRMKAGEIVGSGHGIPYISGVVNGYTRERVVSLFGAYADEMRGRGTLPTRSELVVCNSSVKIAAEIARATGTVAVTYTGEVLPNAVGKIMKYEGQKIGAPASIGRPAKKIVVLPVMTPPIGTTIIPKAGIVTDAFGLEAVQQIEGGYRRYKGTDETLVSIASTHQDIRHQGTWGDDISLEDTLPEIQLPGPIVPRDPLKS
jgi:hypothetical protein